MKNKRVLARANNQDLTNRDSAYSFKSKFRARFIARTMQEIKFKIQSKSKDLCYCYLICFVIIISLIVFSWYRKGYVILRGDLSPWYVFSEKRFIDDLIDLWFKRGPFWNSGSITVLYESIYVLFSKIGLDLGFIQIFLECLFVDIAIIGSFVLIRELTNANCLILICSSFFYVFNIPYMQLRIFSIPYNAFQAFLPLSLALYKLYLKYRDKKYLISFPILSAFFLPLIALNLSMLLLYLVILMSSIFISILFNFKANLVLNINLILFTFLTNIYWILPYIYYTFFYISQSNIMASIPAAEAWAWTSSRSSFLNIFWLNPFWSWRPEYIPYIDFFDNPFVLFISFFPFICASFSLLIPRPSTRLHIAIITLALAILVFLVKGLHEPYSNIYIAILRVFPYASILFREPQTKFMPLAILLISILISYTLNYVYSKLRNGIIKNTFIFCVFFLFLIPNIPLFTGKAIDAKTDLLPFSSYVKIPQYWFDIGQFFDMIEGNYTVLILPLNDFYQVGYKWGYYGADSLPIRAIRKPTLYSPYGLGYLYLEAVDRELKLIQEIILTGNNSNILVNKLCVLNVRFILIRKDIIWNYSGIPLLKERRLASPFDIENKLKAYGFTFIKNVGELTIYENPQWEKCISYYKDG